MTLKFNRVLEVVKVHVHAKFHHAKCSGSRVIVVTEKQKLSDDAENNTAVASAGSNNGKTKRVTLRHGVEIH